MTSRPFVSLAVLAVLLLAACDRPASKVTATKLAATDLWQVYEQSLKSARYVDLTHTMTPSIPVWKGFGPSTFGPAVDPQSGRPYNYAKDGFEATRYDLATDQFGTQLDPPAHWAPEVPAIDELPATYAVRPLTRPACGIDAKRGLPQYLMCHIFLGKLIGARNETAGCSQNRWITL